MKISCSFRSLALSALPFLMGSRAQALTVVATFDGTSYTPEVRQAVNGALAVFSARFSDDLTVYVRFIDSGALNGAVGRTVQDFWPVTYSSFLTALRNDSASMDDATALRYLPFGTGPFPEAGINTPVPGSNSSVWLTRGHAASLGLYVAPVPDAVTKWDATVDLDLSVMFHDRSNPDPEKYDLRGTVLHEIAEVLGTTSNLADFSEADRGIRPLDLFRYQSDGNRTFTTSGDDAWFSLNGTRLLARFNQASGGDYGDFWSPGSPVNDNRPFQVQDAFNTPGLTAEMNVELRLLDVVGFDPILPASRQPELQRLANGQNTLKFYVVPFQDYMVQRSEDLSAWQTQLTATADKDGVLTWTDAAPPELRGFYRAVLPVSAP